MTEQEDEIPDFKELIREKVKAIQTDEIGYYAISSKRRQKDKKYYLTCEAKEVHIDHSLSLGLKNSLDSFVNGIERTTRFTKYTDIDEPTAETIEYLKIEEVDYAKRVVESISNSAKFLNGSDLSKMQNLGYAVKFSNDLIGIGRIYRRNLFRKNESWLAEILHFDNEVTFKEIEGETYFELSNYFPVLIVSNHLLIRDETDFESIFVYDEKLTSQLETQEGEMESVLHAPKKFISRIQNNRRELKSLSIGTQGTDYSKFTKDYITKKIKEFNLEINTDKDGKIITSDCNTWHVVQLLTERLYQGELSQKRYRVHTRESI